MTEPWVDPLDRAVENVEQHQRCGFFHPYTCGNRDHDWRKDDGLTTLKPEKREGDIWLVCSCGYEQRLTALDGMMIEGVRMAGDPLAEFRG